MNNLKYKYFIIKEINRDITIIDRVRKTIFSIKDGMYVNITKSMQKLYEKDVKNNFRFGFIGTRYLETLLNGYYIGSESDLILKTNDRKKFDLKCMEIRKEQLQNKISTLNYFKEKLLKNEQYYTYAFSDVDDVYEKEKVSDKYTTKDNKLENNLSEILKPQYYEEKDVEVTILDKEYDLGTTFYYIEEAKDNYEKFMKYLSENIIVKEIWKNEDTLIVGIGEFVRDYAKEFTNLFGEQMEEVYIENLIKMIDGNATESCYEDFLKEFKNNFMFCNNHTFEEIKETSIDDLDYEKAHDLAFIENKETHTSAYLGVYDNCFQLTYNVHSQNDFDNNYENIIVEPINMSDIKCEEELKEIMKNRLNDFYNSRSEFVEALSKKLDEGTVEEQEEDEETI